MKTETRKKQLKAKIKNLKQIKKRKTSQRKCCSTMCQLWK